MTEYHLVIDQHVRYTTTVEAESPEKAVEHISFGLWDDTNNEVLSDRVQVYDETEEQLLHDTAPDPDDPITVTLQIDNVYEDGTSFYTIVEAEVGPPPPDDSDEYDDWLQENIFEHTGTGKTEGDAGYFVKVAKSSRPDLLPVGTEYEFC